MEGEGWSYYTSSVAKKGWGGFLGYRKERTEKNDK